MKSRTAWKITLIFLSLYLVLIWLIVFSFPPFDQARLIACDVGQGDALLIIDGSAQILIDGGPNGEVINCLSKYMPFWDRTLELVILTHPEADHFTGLIDVFERYQVKAFLANDLKNSTESYQVLEDLVQNEGSQRLFPVSSQHLRLGLIYLDLLHPTEAFLSTDPYIENSNFNDYSLVFTLKREGFTALFTGDILPENSAHIQGFSDVDLIKVPHHGSKNGLTKEMLEATQPETALISVGKNQWGHPNQETLDLLDSAGIKILRTDLLGDIVLNMD